MMFRFVADGTVGCITVFPINAVCLFLRDLIIVVYLSWRRKKIYRRRIYKKYETE